jgi:hypothetical protein
MGEKAAKSRNVIVKSLLAISLCGVIVTTFLVGVRFGRDNKLPMLKAEKEYTTKRVAIVNLDEGVARDDGTVLNYASELLSSLDSSFTFAGLADARSGVSGGVYAGYIIVPATFSSDVESVNSNPNPSDIQYFVSSNLTKNSQSDVIYHLLDFTEKLNSDISYLYVNAILDEFHQSQNHAKTVMSNDTKDTQAILEIEPLNLITLVPIPELTPLPEDIESVDVSEYMDKHQNKVDEINTKYTGYIELSKADYDVLVGAGTTLTGNLKSQIEVLKNADFVHLPKETPDSEAKLVYADSLDNFKIFYNNQTAGLANAKINTTTKLGEISGSISELKGDYDTLYADYGIWAAEYNNLIDKYNISIANYNNSVDYITKSIKHYNTGNAETGETIILTSFLPQKEENIKNNIFDLLKEYFSNGGSMEVRAVEVENWVTIPAVVDSDGVEITPESTILDPGKPYTYFLEMGNTEDVGVTQSELYGITTMTDAQATADAINAMYLARFTPHTDPQQETPSESDFKNNFKTIISTENLGYPVDKIIGNAGSVIEDSDKKAVGASETDKYLNVLNNEIGTGAVSENSTLNALIRDISVIGYDGGDGIGNRVTGILDILKNHAEGVAGNLKSSYEVQDTNLTSYRESLEGYDPLSYIDNTEISGIVGEMRTNGSDLQAAMNTNIAKHIELKGKVYETTIENISKLQQSISEQQKASEEAVKSGVDNAKNVKSESGKSNQELLLAFTEKLPYTRIGSVENTKASEFIVDPIKASMVGLDNSSNVGAVEATKETKEGIPNVVLYAGIISSLLVLIASVIALARKEKRLWQIKSI